MNFPALNLLVAWLWVVLGFVSGLALGLNFHRENWLGGFGSYRRRLYRLGHISFFGLAIVNFMFFFTARTFQLTDTLTHVASGGFVAGAVSMPASCWLMARSAKWRAVFLIPVASLVIAAGATFLKVVNL